MLEHKDTIISVICNVSTQHEIRLAGSYSAEMLDNLKNAVEGAQDVLDAVQILEDEEMRVLAYEEKGRVLDRTVEWQMARQAAKRPPDTKTLTIETITPLAFAE